MKVGVMIPTYRRPDLARRAVLQWIVQTRKPDLLCVHQNGNEESYEWAVEDLKPLINIKWIHSPNNTPQHYWYLIPLSYLLREGCDAFFWGDHDDIYFTNHVETSLNNLQGSDITLNDTCGVLYVDDKDYRYQTPAPFKAHAPGGMSSSMAFNKDFALRLQYDLMADTEYYYSDNVVAFKTMPGLEVKRASNVTTLYVCHKGTHSSSHWTESIFHKGE
jgi:hypothetical protein